MHCNNEDVREGLSFHLIFSLDPTPGVINATGHKHSGLCLSLHEHQNTKDRLYINIHMTHKLHLKLSSAVDQPELRLITDTTGLVIFAVNTFFIPQEFFQYFRTFFTN